MEPYKLYIQQASYDGEQYTYGAVVDTYREWNVVCSKSPYRRFGDPKDVATRNWLDEHGEDVYIPQNVKFKKFDAEFTFLCCGTPQSLRRNIRDFLLYLAGEIGGGAAEAVGARLVIYDTYNQIGWKDVRMKSYSTDGLLMTRGEDDAVLEFKVTFEVYDPYTQVILHENNGTYSLSTNE